MTPCTDLDEFDDTSIFENKAGLAEDMRFLASIPELTDITFLVGDTREPVCAVRAVLAARCPTITTSTLPRSRVFNKMLFHPSSRHKLGAKEGHVRDLNLPSHSTIPTLFSFPG